MNANTLIAYAVKNIWCSPPQDKKAILRLPRITPPAGVGSSWTLMGITYPTPKLGGRFHYFQIGRLSPKTVGLPESSRQWLQLSTVCKENKVACIIYTQNGVKIDNGSAWYFVTENGNWVIAIEHLSRYGYTSDTKAVPVSLNTDSISMQCFQNAYYNSTRWSDFQTLNQTTISEPVRYSSVVAQTTSDIITLQSEYNYYLTQPGQLLAFRNGLLTKDISLPTCQVGDILEIFYDASVGWSAKIPLSDLRVFDSTVDNVGKYLVHHENLRSETINFEDDVSLYLVHRTTGEGVFFHRNQGNTLRNVTHCDYALLVSRVSNALSLLSAYGDFADFDLCVHVRHSGFSRPLVHEHHRITELYKLPQASIIEAMVGTSATISSWQAASLEASAYCTMMRSPYRAITADQVVDTLGYNACAAVAGPSFMPLINGSVTVPSHFQGDSTAFEYSSTGKLLSWQNISGMSYYISQSAGASAVEFTIGHSRQALDETHQVLTWTIDPTVDWRVYSRAQSSNPQDLVWRDATGDESVYIQTDTEVIFNELHQQTHDVFIRTNKYNLIIEKVVSLMSGAIALNLVDDTPDLDGALEVPMAQLDVFLQGRPLIPGIEYTYKHPHVIISATQGIDPSDTMPLLIRGCGLCSDQLQPMDLAEVGYCLGGRLSVDQEYDIRDDRLQRLIMAGGMRFAADYHYAENNVDYDVNHIYHGQPYAIVDSVIPVRSFTGRDSYQLKLQSMAIDRQVGDYLSYLQPQVVPDLAAPATKYSVLSPFLFEITVGIVNSVFTQSQMVLAIASKTELISMLQPFKYLLDYDPIQSTYSNWTYLQLRPHPFAQKVILSAHAFAVLQNIVEVTAPGRLDVSDYYVVA